MKKVFEVLTLTVIVFVALNVIIRNDPETMKLIQFVMNAYDITYEQFQIGFAVESFLVAAILNTVIECIVGVLIDIAKLLKKTYSFITTKRVA